MSKIERRSVVERILEDSSLTSDLIDSAARLLLEWGVGEVTAILEEMAGSPQDELVQRIAVLRRTIRSVNHLAGQAPPEAQVERVQQLLNTIIGSEQDVLSS